MWEKAVAFAFVTDPKYVIFKHKLRATCSHAHHVVASVPEELGKGGQKESAGQKRPCIAGKMAKVLSLDENKKICP